jgi:hypothetical protein
MGFTPTMAVSLADQRQIMSAKSNKNTYLVYSGHLTSQTLFNQLAEFSGIGPDHFLGLIVAGKEIFHFIFRIFLLGFYCTLCMDCIRYSKEIGTELFVQDNVLLW